MAQHSLGTERKELSTQNSLLRENTAQQRRITEESRETP